MLNSKADEEANSPLLTVKYILKKKAQKATIGKKKTPIKEELVEIGRPPVVIQPLIHI